MPLYRITAPNGLTYQIEGPDGASDADVARAVMAQHPEAGNPAKPASFSAADTALAFGQSLLGAGKSLTDVAGAGNVVSETLAKGQKYLGEQMTPERQAEIQRRQEKIKAAGKEGILSEIGAELGAIKEAPLTSTVQALGSIVPYAITGGIGAAAKLLPATLRAVNTVVGVLQGTGSIKGSIYDAVEKELVANGMPEAKAKEQASAAQDYLGKNIGQIALGAGLGGVGARYGVEKLFEKGAGEKLSESIGKRVVKAGAAEAPMEGAQGAQEQVAQNIALQREGFNVPTFQGVAGRAAGDAALGALAAGAVGAVRAPTPKPVVPPTIPKEPPASAQGELFTPQELAGLKRPAGQKEELPPEAPASTAAPEGQLSLGLEAIREYADLVRERERLKSEPKTPETTARIADLTQQLQDRNLYEIDRLRAEQAEDAAAREQFPALAEAPLVPRSQQELFSAEEAPPGVPPAAQAEEQAIPEPTLKEPYQYKLPLRTVPEGKNVRRIIPETKPEARPEAAPEPTQLGGFTEQDILDTGLPARSSMKWLQDNVVGKTKEELQTLVTKKPDLLEGRGSRAQILKALLAPEAAPYKEPTNVPITETGAPAGEEPARPVPTRGRKRLRLPVQRGAGVSPAEPTTPDGRGVDVAGPPTGEPITRETTQPPALTEEPSEPKPKAKVGKPAAAPAPTKTPAAKPAGPATQAVAQETPEEEAARKKEAAEMAARLEQVTKADARKDPYRPVKAAPERGGREAPGPTKAQMDGALDEIIAAENVPEKDKAEAKRMKKVLKDKETPDSDLQVFNFLTRQAAAQRYRSVSTQEPSGRTVEDVRKELEQNKSRLGRAIAALIKNGKLVIKQESPEPGVAGEFDGRIATLYADSIRDGNALGVVLHEVGAHMGLKNLLGDKNYTAIADRIRELYASKTPSPARALAQRAMNSVPENTPKNQIEDEIIAYFIEDLARAEANGELAKVGPLRAVWNQIKAAVTAAVNRALGTNLGMSDLRPQDIGAMAEAALIRESKTELLPETTKEVKRMFSVSPSTETLVDSMGNLDAQEKSALTNLVDAFKTQGDVGYATKFRVQYVDTAAAVEHKLRQQFDGAVRNSLGKVNPMGLYRQAQDHTKMLLEYFQQGAIAKDPDTALWKVTTKDNVPAPVQVYALIDDWAAKNGYTRERGTQIASRVLEGVRLDALRTSNKNDGTEFKLHLSDADIDQLVAEYKAQPELQEMSRLMDKARIDMVDNMIAVGRLSPEEGKAWKDVSGYVPFDRIDDFSERFNKVKKISSKGLAQVGKLPELVGSLNRPVGNVFDNYLNTLGWMVGQTLKTDGTVQTLRALEDAGYAKFLGRSTQNKDNTVGMYVKGEMMYWELPSKYDVMAFKDLSAPKAGWLRALGAFSNVLRKTVTALPPFALKQVTDDVQRAILTSGVHNPGALIRMTLTNFPKLALAELRGIQHPIVKEFGALGLTGEYDFQQGKPAVSLLKDLGYKPRGRFETLLHKLDGITRASDLSVRKAIYDQTMKETQDALLAQTRAREFINFRRRGASDTIAALTTTIPFFNAYVQGMDVLYRAASGKDSSASVGRAQARRLFWSRASAVVALSTMYAMMMSDDDEYNEMDLRIRDNNWILPGGTKLPVPGELGVLFKVIPERVVEYMKRQGTPEEQDAAAAVRSALATIAEQYVGRVTPVPQAVKPLLEAWANKSFLTGRELEGIHHKQIDPSERRTDQTSELAMAIAKFSRDNIGVQVSPIMVDNALRGYFGSTAAMTTMITDSLLNPTRVDRPLHKWALFSNYMYDPVGTRRMTEFYEEREKVGKANATLNELMKTNPDRAEKYVEEHQDELLLEGAVNSTLEQLEKTRAYRKYLNSPIGAENMPKEERESELKELRKMEVELTSWLREAKNELAKAQ
jgi:hypothetical protein